MVLAQAPTIRHAVRTRTAPLLLQKRWARIQDVRFVATHGDSQGVLERYKDKLEQKAKLEGHRSTLALKDAYKAQISKQHLSAKSLSHRKKSEQVQHPFQQPPPPSPKPQLPSTFPSAAPFARTTSEVPGIKPLSAYLDLVKVSNLPKKELEHIWRLRHASNPQSLCAVIPLETYTRIHQAARIHPQFVLPLPRVAEGKFEGTLPEDLRIGNKSHTAAEIHFLQWNFHPPTMSTTDPQLKTANTHTSTVLFTHLASYKLHGAFALPHTTITHHLDLADTHGLVLLNGSVIEGRGVSVEEGRWLTMCLQKFYDFQDHGIVFGKEKRQGLLEKFSEGDQDFRIEELIDEAERFS